MLGNPLNWRYLRGVNGGRRRCNPVITDEEQLAQREESRRMLSNPMDWRHLRAGEDGLLRCNPVSDKPDLATIDMVTQTMSEVVVQLVGDVESSIYSRLRRHLESGDPSLTPRPEVNAIFTSLVHILQRGPHSAADEIRASPGLLARAKYIASAANVGEHHMEAHYALKMVCADLGVCQQPKCRVRLLAGAAEPFPYVDNYVRLVGAECRVFMSALKHVGHVAVVGSGPVPLTGALIAAQLGARVTLIDKDAQATHLARGLVRRWESVGALDEGQVIAIVTDATDVRFARGVATMGAVEADVVLVASLVPDNAKAAVARNTRNEGWNGLLAVRSAHGLIAVANYQRANRDALQKYMDYVGYVVPCACVEDSRVAGERQQPVAIFPRDVLNSIELYVEKSDDQRIAKKTRGDIIRECGKGVL